VYYFPFLAGLLSQFFDELLCHINPVAVDLATPVSMAFRAEDATLPF